MFNSQALSPINLHCPTLWRLTRHPNPPLPPGHHQPVLRFAWCRQLPQLTNSSTNRFHLNSFAQSQTRSWRTLSPLPMATITNAGLFVVGSVRNEAARWQTRPWRIWKFGRTMICETVSKVMWENILKCDVLTRLLFTYFSIVFFFLFIYLDMYTFFDVLESFYLRIGFKLVCDSLSGRRELVLSQSTYSVIYQGLKQHC